MSIAKRQEVYLIKNSFCKNEFISLLVFQTFLIVLLQLAKNCGGFGWKFLIVYIEI